MLDFLRKQAQSPLIQTVVVIIAVVFIFWGVGTNLGGSRSSVATVNGTEIPGMDFSRAYSQALDGLQQQFGGRMPSGFAEQLGIREQVLHRLIQAELLRQGGAEAGIRVSELPVQQRIAEMEVFQEKGKFSLQRYKDVLSQNRMTPGSFEKGLKSDLSTERVQELVGDFTVISDNAASRWQAWSNEQLKLAYVKLEPAAFESKVAADDKALAAWFEKNKERYRSEPKVRLKYLLFNQSDDEKEIKIADEELTAKYEQDKESYRQPEQRHARHILFKIEKNAPEDIRAEKKKQAEAVLAQAKAKEADFAALAKQHSEDASNKDMGGDLGFFAAGRMVPAFDAAVFAMQPGDISGPIETEFGFHLIKLEEIKPETVRSFEQVKDSIAASLKREQAKALSFKRAAAAYEAVMKAGSLDKYSQQEAGKVQVTEPFSRSEHPQGLPADPKFIEAAFSLKKGELSSIIELREGYAVLFADDMQEPEQPKLEAVKDKALADWKKEKAAELAAKAAADLLAASREKKELQTPEGGTVTVTGLLKRTASGEENAPPDQVRSDAFKLAWKEKLPAAPVQAENVWFVYEVRERLAGESKTDDDVRQQLSASARRDLLTAWLASLQNKAKIRISLRSRDDEPQQ
ncbi:SurA N-terminal domain-containing protein [Candidatus Electronema sp. TJ]|uniref:SurA N-terminal domain-containing protein n=1 Tax=Candidatus Electronema sp. TJ TaxID=3401573 RepID=UPI003AA93E22